MKNRTCKYEYKSPFYYDFGVYKCLYCEGILTDLKRVELIIRYNIPATKTQKEIEEQVAGALDIQRKFIEKAKDA